VLMRAQYDIAERRGNDGLYRLAERGRGDRGTDAIQRRHQMSSGLTSAAFIR
jgi:hypothetical protein